MLTNDRYGGPSQGAERLTTWSAVVLLTLAMGWLQFSFSGLFDLDSYFHSRAAIELADEGIQTTLPAATFSTWSDAYSDKDFLFHVLIVPFVAEETLSAGGKWAVLALDFLLFAAVAFALRRLDIRFGALWLLLLIGASSYYVMRLLPLRPQLLGLALLALEIALLDRDRWRALFVVGTLHVLAHSSFPLVILLVGLRFVSGALTHTPLPWRSATAIVAGLTLGSALHPYFPNNLTIAWSQIFQLAGHLWGTTDGIPVAAFGSELGPMSFKTFGKIAPAWIPAATGLGAWILFGRGRWSQREIFLGLTTLSFLGLAFATRRFIDIFVVAALLLAGTLWTRLADGKELKVLLRRRWGAIAGALLVGCVGWGLTTVWTDLPVRLPSYATGEIFQPAVQKLDQIADPDDIVYHPTWSEFSFLYAFRPQGRYISGLDPVYFYGKHPKLFDKRWRLRLGRVKNPYAILHGDFGARWVLLPRRKRYRRFQKLLERSPRIRLVWQDGAAQIWSVDPQRIRSTP